MFQELMASIWEEFARVIFHVEVNIEPAQAEQMFAEERAPSRRRRPVLGRRRRGAALGDRARRRRRPARSPRRLRRSGHGGGRGRRQRRSGVNPGDRRQVRGREDRPQRPLLVRLGQEVQEVPRRLTALARGRADRPPRPVRPRRLRRRHGDDLGSRLRLQPHRTRGIAGATIRVRELPGLSAVTDANGDYELEVPDDTNVTPYIEPPDGYNQIDLQTFHTRGKPIRNANFQTPADAEYNGLAALLVGAARPGRASRAVRDRHHRLGAQRARGRLRDLPGAHPARRRRRDGARDPAAARPDLLQRHRDPGPLADGDLGRRRDHLDRRSRPAATG